MINNQQSLPIGTVVKGGGFNYKIVGVLGQGSFGITYLCELSQGDTSSGMLVCLKEFFMSDINGRDGSLVSSGSESGLFDDYRRKFIREAKNLARIKDENVVKVIECFEQNNTVYYSMSYIAGGSLDQLIAKRGRIPTAEALMIARDLASALDSLHKEGMLHLDLKPGNVMMLGEERPILIDFGLSKNFNQSGEPESSTTIGGGTPGYAPIEQVSYVPGGQIPVTMDVYALGATLYKMLTGKRPPLATDIFNDGFPLEHLRSLGINENVIWLIQKAMMPSRNDRFQSMTEVIAAIDSILPTLSANEATQFNPGHTPPPRPPQPTPQTFHQPEQANFQKRRAQDSHGSGTGKKVGYIIGGIVIGFILLFAIAMMIPDNDNNAVIETETEYADTNTQNSVTVEAATENEVQSEAAPTENETEKAVSSNETYTLEGEMAGYPIRLVLDIGDYGNVTGKYYNINYNVTFNVTGHLGEGAYDLILTHGNTRCRMELYEGSSGVSGTFTSESGKELDVNLRYV